MIKKTKRRVGAYLYEATAGGRIPLSLLIVLQIALSLANIGFVLTMAAALDSAVAGEHSALRLGLLTLIGWVVLRLGMRFVLRHLEESVRATVENNLKNRLLSCLLHGSYAQVRATHTGQWMNRLTSDTAVVAGGLTGILPQLLGMLVRLIGAASMLLVMIPQAAYFLIPGGIAAMAIALTLRTQTKKRHKAVQESDGALRAFLQDRLGSMTVLRAFRAEAATQAEADQKMQDHKQQRLRKNLLSNLCSTAFTALMYGLYLLGFAYCSFGLLQGQISYGTLLAVIQLIGQIQAPFAGLSGIVPQYYAMTASAERLLEAEGFPQEAQCDEAAPEFSQLHFRNVSFAYPEEPQVPVLKNVELVLHRGDFAALTGPSGTGKSTVFKLLLQLYSPDDGQITLNGIQEPLQARHRPLFAYVPQGNPLMCGTVGQLVTFSQEPDDPQRIWDALRTACADSFVSELEKGLDTPLGEQGAGLSEGQLQRLAIARAVYSDAPVLLLDECTSALDLETETQVLQNLKALPGKTALIVTHRPAALSYCSRRLHLNEDGTMEEILSPV